MKTRPNLILLVLCSLGTLLSGVERVETKVWEVGDIPIVKLDTYRGDILVEQSESGRVELIMKASAPDEKATDWLENIEVKSTPFGAGRVISIVNTRTGVEFGVGEMPMRSVELTLRVPQVSNLDIRARQGSIEIGHGFEGQMRARIENGNVFVGRTKGSVVVQTEVGDISVARATGNLTATSKSGNLFIGTVLGWAQLPSDSGDIEVTNTWGGVDVVAAAGAVKIGVDATLLRDSRVEARAGGIVLGLNPESVVEIDARAIRGEVDSEISFETTAFNRSDRELRGSLNGGGALIALVSSGGDVDINSVPVFKFEG